MLKFSIITTFISFSLFLKTDFFDKDRNIVSSTDAESKKQIFYTYHALGNLMRNIALFDGLNSYVYVSSNLLDCEQSANINNCNVVTEYLSDDFISFDNFNAGEFQTTTTLEFCDAACLNF
jgi:hypothetical protein